MNQDVKLLYNFVIIPFKLVKVKEKNDKKPT